MTGVPEEEDDFAENGTDGDHQHHQLRPFGVHFVVNASDGKGPRHLQPEHYAILARTREPVTVAELASHLDLALGVVRVLLGDLLQQGLIEMHEPVYDQSVGPQRPDDRILKAVVNGLRSL